MNFGGFAEAIDINIILSFMKTNNPIQLLIILAGTRAINAIYVYSPYRIILDARAHSYFFLNFFFFLQPVILLTAPKCTLWRPSLFLLLRLVWPNIYGSAEEKNIFKFKAKCLLLTRLLYTRCNQRRSN